jgi:hypothetical protein
MKKIFLIIAIIFLGCGSTIQKKRECRSAKMELVKALDNYLECCGSGKMAWVSLDSIVWIEGDSTQTLTDDQKKILDRGETFPEKIKKKFLPRPKKPF